MSDKLIQVSRKFEVANPMKDTLLPIPYRDWLRLMRRAEGCGRHTFPFEALWLTFLGMALSAFLSAVALHAAGSVPSWTLRLNWIAFVICLMIAALAFFFGRIYNKAKAERIADVIEDMRHIAGCFELPGTREISDDQ